MAPLKSVAKTPGGEPDREPLLRKSNGCCVVMGPSYGRHCPVHETDGGSQGFFACQYPIQIVIHVHHSPDFSH